MDMGHFITLEGGDGAGKTTLLKKLEAHFQERKIPLLLTREPGGSPLAEEIRSLLLKPRSPQEIPGPLTELFLFEAARADHVEKTIRPTLLRGTHVLCDRFTDSSLAFQGVARGLGIDLVEQLNAIATSGLSPSIVVWLRVSPENARKRRAGRAEHSRIDAESEAFHEIIHRAFSELSEKYPERYLILDADQNPDEIFRSLLAHPKWTSLFPGPGAQTRPKDPSS